MSFEEIRRGRLAGALLAAGIGFAAPGLADDRPFITLSTTDLLPSGEAEFEQSMGWFSGHAGASFNAVTAQSEIEYGFAPNLQGSLYLTYDWSRTRPAGGPVSSADFIGTKAEIIYRVLDPLSDPIGLAVYLEPSINPAEHGLETKILLQKNFLENRLRTVININFEDVWAKNDLGHFDEESALELRAGVAYALTPQWSVGLEFANEHGFDGLILGGSARENQNAYFLGPTLQYDGEPFKLVFGVQAQLPVAGGGFAPDAERFRAGLRLAWDL